MSKTLYFDIINILILITELTFNIINEELKMDIGYTLDKRRYVQEVWSIFINSFSNYF